MTKKKTLDCLLVVSLCLITTISNANVGTARKFPIGVTFRQDTLYRSDGRGDNWCITWAADDSQITSMCDGNWLNDRQSYHNHLYRIIGDPDHFQRDDISNYPRFIWGTGSWFGYGIVSIDGALYSVVSKTPANQWSGPFRGIKLLKSEDNGATWYRVNRYGNERKIDPLDNARNDVSTNEMFFLEEFGLPHQDKEAYPFSYVDFVKNGKDNSATTDDYVYIYSPEGANSNRLLLARVHKDRIGLRRGWEYFQKYDDNEPIWTSDIIKRGYVHIFPEKSKDGNYFGWYSWLPSVVWNEGLGFYIMVNGGTYAGHGMTDSDKDYYDSWMHTRTGSLGFWYSENPFGPWHQFYYTDYWTVDNPNNRTYQPKLSPRWISKDGSQMVLIWSDAMKNSSGKSHTVNYRWNQMKITIETGQHQPAVNNDTKNTTTTILKADPENPAGKPGNGFKITYRWQALPLEKDYTVFVHFVDKDGKIVLQDDHNPPTPTSKWSGKVEYTRTVPLEQWQVKDKRTVYVGLPEGDYTICTGLYDKNEGNIALNTGPGVTNLGNRQYKIGVLSIDSKASIPEPGKRTLDLTGYRLTFNEEFDDLSVSAWGPAGMAGTRWIAHTPWHGDFGDAKFTDPNPGFPFTIKDSVLCIEVRKVDGRWRSGLLSAVDPKGNGFKQKYGYFECRAKFPKGPGTWPAFWLMGLKSLKGLPGNTRPRVNPEIDVVEHYGHWPWRYHYVLHQWGRGGAESKHDGKRFVVLGMEEDLHTYGVMIDEQYVILYFDGVELHREKTPESVKTPLFPLVNLALGPGWPTDKTPNPSYMYVDYIKVWKKGKEPIE